MPLKDSQVFQIHCAFHCPNGLRDTISLPHPCLEMQVLPPHQILRSLCLTFQLRCLSVSDKNIALAGCFVILISAEFIAAMVSFAELLPITFFTKSGHTTFPLHSIWASAAMNAGVDTALALTLVILLHRRRSEVRFTRTSSIVDRIMMYTVGSGLLTAAFALAGLVTSLTMTKNFVFVLILEMLPKRESIIIIMCFCVSLTLANHYSLFQLLAHFVSVTVV